MAETSSEVRRPGSCDGLVVVRITWCCSLLQYGCIASPLVHCAIGSSTSGGAGCGKWALRRAAPGPYRWALPTDLWRLRSSYGLPFRFRALSWTAFASQARVHHLEASACGGLRVGARLRALRSWRSDSPHIVRAALWSPWLDSAHVKILSDAVEKLTQISASPRQAEAVLAKGSPRPWPRAVALAVRRGLQRWMTSAMEQA